jgi:LytS/YehU family sensor histidine kinase
MNAAVQPTSQMPLSQQLTRRTTTVTILLFWSAQFGVMTAGRIMTGAGDDVTFLPPRLLVTVIGVLLSFGIAAVHQRSRGSALSRRLVLAVAAALVCSVLHAVANFVIFHLFMPLRNWEDATIGSYALAVLQWFWAYSALSGLLLSVVYSAEMREYERRAAQLQREAHSAHLRALRYQLNPHFMFNTLNSIASLISTKAVEPAERMVENLSDFLRAGLALDPNEDISLAKEIELQSLYLAIEAERFPDRLRVEIDVPRETRRALVPSLIIQPVVENAVRHAVATSTTPVTLHITARVANGRLELCVRDSGGNGADPARTGSAGTGVGLKNVAERLSTRYGEDCDFVAGPEPDGGFATRFSIPLEGVSE